MGPAAAVLLGRQWQPAPHRPAPAYRPAALSARGGCTAHTHVFAARSGVEHILRGDALILRAGAALAAYKATGPLEAIATGPGAGIEYRNHGREQGWAVIVSHGRDFDRFADYVEQCRLGLDQEGTRLLLSIPEGLEHVLDWTGGLSVDGAPAATGDLPTEPGIEFTDIRAG